ncbi:PhzF family phenazine biosynthesis protein [Aspergillus stella-maris]|uniref:PhzF family phenazine biosynthesis protein n=1 Tax=Aspergillus stella-maris TaxID=1810926 RepID=UPI003CCE068D
MSREQAPYVTLDVFSSERFKGNPLAIVNTSNINLSPEEQQTLAKEFNYSETVFLSHPDKTKNPKIAIWTPQNEMELAGHPVIGTGHYLFHKLLANTGDGKAPRDITVETKAGPVLISIDPSTNVVYASIPHNVHVHSIKASLDRILPVQKSLQGADLLGVSSTFPVVSIVKGVTYVLVDLFNRPDLFSSLVPGPNPTVELDAEWTPSFTGTIYYKVLNTSSKEDSYTWDLRVRMMAIDLEDPATGSAGCTLGAYLALSFRELGKKHRFNISQGTEMGRESNIAVEVKLNKEGTSVSSVKLAGEVAFVAEGTVFVR